MKEIFDNNFNDILIDADLKYQKKKFIYGESWKSMSPNELHMRLNKEIEELNNSFIPESIHDECIDIINCALMLAKRLKLKYLR